MVIHQHVLNLAVAFLTGDFPGSAEFQNLGMAIQGAMNVRKGPNREKKLHWFHAFMLSVVAGFAGGIFTFIWMGMPSSILSNDLGMGSCIIAFAFVNFIPFDLGYFCFNALPISLLITSSAQLFRSLSLVKFVKTCFLAFRDSPSDYYPIPVFGPIIYGTLLGNMGALFMKGFEYHVGNGVPWMVQNGVFCSSFYHFYVHDTDGCIGQFLRSCMPFSRLFDMDDATIACAFVSLFMQVMGILQMPEFLGPNFSPFTGKVISPFKDTATWNVGKEQQTYSKTYSTYEKADGKLPAVVSGQSSAQQVLLEDRRKTRNIHKKTKKRGTSKDKKI